MTGAVRPSGEQGFSLVEAIVALAIIATMTGVLAGAWAEDAHARHALRQRREAMLLARSVMDRAVAGEAGDAGGWQEMRWRVSRQPYGAADPLAGAALEQIDVNVSDAAQHPLAALTTVRVR